MNIPYEITQIVNLLEELLSDPYLHIKNSRNDEDKLQNINCHLTNLLKEINSSEEKNAEEKNFYLNTLQQVIEALEKLHKKLELAGFVNEEDSKEIFEWSLNVLDKLNHWFESKEEANNGIATIVSKAIVNDKKKTGNLIDIREKLLQRGIDLAKLDNQNKGGKSIMNPENFVDVVIITALDEELDFLYDDLRLDWSDPKVQQDGITYRRGHLTEQIDVIATSAGSMGLVPTAILSAKVLKEWNPPIAAMIGICGGIKENEKKLNIGDIVVAEQCFHYQFGAFENGEIKRELRVESTKPEILKIVNYIKQHTQVLSDIKNSLSRGFAKPNTDLQCYVAPMASADLVVKSVKKLEDATRASRKTIAVDMESYAFMKATTLAKTPWSFVIKSVSDFADSQKDKEYREYAKYTSTKFFIEIVKNIVERGLIKHVKEDKKIS